MNGKEPPNAFTDFLSPTTSDEGPVRARDIPRQRYKRRREHRHKKRRSQRAS